MEVVECRRCGRSRPVQPGGALGESCPYCLLMFMFGDDDEPSEAGEAATDRIPERLGPYRLLELLGAGGMGTVYRAHHEALDRTVALKMLRPEFAARAGFRERFQHEARVLASLTHPDIVGIHDTGCDGGIYYLAMEYVAGTTLRERLKAGPLGHDEALAIFYTLNGALLSAHARGIVHRDVKPENVLLDEKGAAKLTDFGVAKLLDADTVARVPKTEVDAVVGTRRYMAPEQLEPGRVIDQRADLYSLAAVFYEMLTGEAPLGAFAPPSQVAKTDPRLDGPIMRALAKDPAARPRDALTLFESVRSALGIRDEVGEKLIAARRRRRILKMGAAGLAIASAGAIVWRLTSRSSPDDALAKLGAHRHVHPAGVWRSVFLTDGVTLLTACGDRQVRSWPASGGDADVLFTGYPQGVPTYLALAPSPDDASLVTAGGENIARVWDLATRSRRFTLTGHTREIADTAWSPDGTLIATAAHDKSVRLWNAADGTSTAVFDALPDPALCVAFSPDGKLLAAGIMNGAIKVWDVATRTLRATLGHQKRVWSVAFVGGEVTRLVSGSHDRTLKLWTFEPDGTVRPKPAALEIGADGEVWSVAVSPHGDLIAAGLNDGTLGLWSYPGGKPIRMLKQHAESIVDVAFSADGARLATSSLDRSAIVWEVARLTAPAA